MNRIYLFVAALVLSLAIAAPASAGCQNVTVGADISVIGWFADNYDYNDNASDAWSAVNEYTHIYIDNIYTEGVSTHIELALAYPLDDATAGSLVVNEAYIKMEEFLTKELTFKIGKFTTKWQLRGDIWGAGTFENIYPYEMNNSFVLNGNTVGMAFMYDATEQVTLSFVWHKINEVSGVAGNTNSDDLDLIIVRVDYTIEANNKLFGAFLYFNDQKPVLMANVWMVNFGVDYFLMDEEALELYFEFVYQDGDAHSASYDLGTFALNLGAEYTFHSIETVPYIGLDITYYQGVDGASYSYSRIVADWTKTLIVENDFNGPITNMTPGWLGVKLVGGMKNVMDEKIWIDFVFAWFKADGDLSPITRGDGIGFEVDAVASYWYTEDVVFTLGFGYFVPDEDLAGFADPDAVWLAVFACTITF
jgi:hypothetical protein